MRGDTRVTGAVSAAGTRVLTPSCSVTQFPWLYLVPPHHPAGAGAGSASSAGFWDLQLEIP